MAFKCLDISSYRSQKVFYPGIKHNYRYIKVLKFFLNKTIRYDFTISQTNTSSAFIEFWY